MLDCRTSSFYGDQDTTSNRMRRTTCFYVLVSSVLLLLQGLQSDVVAEHDLPRDIVDDGRTQKQDLDTKPIPDTDDGNITIHGHGQYETNAKCFNNVCDKMYKTHDVYSQNTNIKSTNRERACSYNTRNSIHYSQRIRQTETSSRRKKLESQSRQRLQRTPQLKRRKVSERRSEERNSRRSNLQRTHKRIELSNIMQNFIENNPGRQSTRENDENNRRCNYLTRNKASLRSTSTYRRELSNVNDNIFERRTRSVEERRSSVTKGENTNTRARRSLGRSAAYRRDLETNRITREQHRMDSVIMRRDNPNGKLSSTRLERSRSSNMTHRLTMRNTGDNTRDYTKGIRRDILSGLSSGNRFSGRQKSERTTSVRSQDYKQLSTSRDSARSVRRNERHKDTSSLERVNQRRNEEYKNNRETQRNNEIRRTESRRRFETRHDNTIRRSVNTEMIRRGPSIKDSRLPVPTSSDRIRTDMANTLRQREQVNINSNREKSWDRVMERETEGNTRRTRNRQVYDSNFRRREQNENVLQRYQVSVPRGRGIVRDQPLILSKRKLMANEQGNRQRARQMSNSARSCERNLDDNQSNRQQNERHSNRINREINEPRTILGERQNERHSNRINREINERRTVLSERQNERFSNRIEQEINELRTIIGERQNERHTNRINREINEPRTILGERQNERHSNRINREINERRTVLSERQTDRNSNRIEREVNERRTVLSERQNVRHSNRIEQNINERRTVLSGRQNIHKASLTERDTVRRETRGAQRTQNSDRRREFRSDTIAMKRRDTMEVLQRNDQRSYRLMENRSQNRLAILPSFSSSFKSFAVENLKNLEVGAIPRAVMVCVVGYLGRNVWMPKVA